MMYLSSLPRYLLGLLIGLLPVLAALPEAPYAGSGGALGMGTPAPPSLEPGKRLSLAPSAQPKLDAGTFEVAQFSPSAAQWLLAGRFLGALRTTLDTSLLLFGKLQLEGG